ncbi:MAG: wax ester/triacylglycerol synthase family O-acyltransferase [Microthrixaceae bacterium]
MTDLGDRLGALDAEFLHIEDGIGHMHIAGACTFDGPPPTYAELEQLMTSKLHLIPRYRQRVRQVPFELGRPVWADDPHFDLRYHLRHTALPPPGDDAALCRLMGRVMSQPLDRDRPLWETWLVEGLEDGRWALMCKVHHCLVDGISGVGLLTVLLDLTPDSELGDPEPWEPAAEPGAARKVLGAWSGLASDAAGQARRALSSMRSPGDAGRNVVDALVGTVHLGRELVATAPLSIEGSIGPHRTWAHSSASFEDVRLIRRTFGGTVNDVVLTAVAAGYAELLRHRGEDVGEATVRTLVPVSTRRESGDGVPDNRVSLMLYELPVDLDDHVERLGAVQAGMAELKGSHMAEVGEIVTTVGDLAPPMVVGPISRWIVRVLRRVPQRSVTTVTTNVPGPQFPLYCLGREMLAYLPYVPITHGVRVGTAILSYNGRLFFGVTGDAATAPDVDVLATATAAAIDELAARARIAADAADAAGGRKRS